MRSRNAKEAAASQCRRVHSVLDQLEELVVPTCAEGDEGDRYVDAKNSLLDKLRQSVDLLATIAISSSGQEVDENGSATKPATNQLQEQISAAVEKAVAPYRAKVISLSAEIERHRRARQSDGAGSANDDPFSRFESLKASTNKSSAGLQQQKESSSPQQCMTSTSSKGVAVDYKELLASHIIDRTFDQHKSLLRSQLHEAVSQLERFRSGAFYKSQIAATEELTAKLAAQEVTISDLKQKLVAVLTERVTQRANQTASSGSFLSSSQAIISRSPETSLAVMLTMGSVAHAWRVFELQQEFSDNKHLVVTEFLLDQLLSSSSATIVGKTPSPPMHRIVGEEDADVRESGSRFRGADRGPPLRSGSRTLYSALPHSVLGEAQYCGPLTSDASSLLASASYGDLCSDGPSRKVVHGERGDGTSGGLRRQLTDALLSCNLPPVHLTDPILPRRALQQPSQQPRQRLPL